ncbi:MAG: hypothetical protein AAGC92_06825 [Pseudomonadota bacterium]
MPVASNAAAEAAGDVRPNRNHAALAEAAARAGGMDAGFRNAARALRLLFHLDNGSWAESFVTAADAARSGAMPAGDKARLWGHLAHHARLTAAGRFGADLAASSERIAIILRACGLGLFEAIGIWAKVQTHLIRIILTDDRMSNRLVRRDAYAALGAWILSETALVAHYFNRDGGARLAV